MNIELLMKLAHSNATATMTACGRKFPVKIIEIDHENNYLNASNTELKCLVLDEPVQPFRERGFSVKQDVSVLAKAANTIYGKSAFNASPSIRYDFIEKVIFNDPATIVFWKDGTKTVVKATNEKYDPEKGLAMAITKKVYGNKGSYFNEVKKWVDKCDYDPNALRCRFGDWLKLENAYVTLTEVMKNKKATKADMVAAMEEAIGYLGEVCR